MLNSIILLSCAVFALVVVGGSLVLAEQATTQTPPDPAERPWAPLESALPQGFPAPGPVDEVALKTLPAYRMARADGRRSFWTLFRHIRKHEIAMTSPVQMTLAPSEAEVDAEHGEDDATEHAGADFRMIDMAFLYGSMEIGETGEDGRVNVMDVPAQHVLSIARVGKLSPKRLAESVAALQAELAAREGWVAAGPPRVMGYHSPMVRADRRLWEVQAPVAKAEAKEEQQVEEAETGDEARD